MRIKNIVYTLLLVITVLFTTTSCSTTPYKYYEFEEDTFAKLPMGGELKFRFSPTDYHVEFDENDRATQIYEGPYTLSMYAKYKKGVTGTIQIKNFSIKQISDGKIVKHDDFDGDFDEKEIQQDHCYKGKCWAYFGFHGVHLDIDYGDLEFSGTVLLQVDGKEPVEARFEHILKTNFREGDSNDFWQAAASV